MSPLYLRWAVSLSQLEANAHFELFYRSALQCVSTEDVEKHSKFMYRDDSLACIVSRLLYRQFAVTVSDCGWDKISIERSERGKPFIKSPNIEHHFNISHQGDLVVLASDPQYPIGVDVMRIDEERGKTADSHREKMAKLFTEREHKMMREQRNEREKWTAFYRIWCLKESVLKATGTGLVNDLRKLEFVVSSEEKHSKDSFITSTLYNDNDVYQSNWLFEESFIGNDHVVAVGTILPSKLCPSRRSFLSSSPSLFQIIDWERILHKSTVLSPIDDGGSQLFEELMKKSLKHF